MDVYFKSKLRLFILSLPIFFLLFSGIHPVHCANKEGLAQREFIYHVPEKTKDGWETSSLNEEDVDPTKINELILYIQNGKYKNIHSVILIKNGKLILDEYFQGYGREKVHEIRSATKSIGSVLTGIAIDHNFLDGVNDKIYPHFKTYKLKNKWNKRAKDVTLKTLLTMTSGYKCDDHKTNFECETNMYKSDDWVRYALNLPMAYKPGEHWAYNSSSLILVGEIISKASKKTIPDFANRCLFEPLGIKDFQWGFSPKRKAWLAGNAKMKPRDMAKVGFMMLNGGKWGNKQIVSQKWINESTRAYEITNNGAGYGYLWWIGKTVINNHKIKTFWAAGNGGNYIFVLSKLDLVVVFTGGNYNSLLEAQVFGMLINHIIPAVLPSPPRKFIKLDDMVLEGYVGKYKTKTDEYIFSVY
ncbi:MAG: serine hydrolase, partial [Deltaproteobacteria bacterium]|nr:serine hydrolase [Deltaproteobacteria bacterium]